MATRPLRRLTVLLAAFVAVVLSCGREAGSPTAPGGGPGVRYTRALAIQPVFPPILAQAGGAAGLIPFDHVHLVLLHADGTVALDTVVTFPPGADQVTLTLTVVLSPNAPAAGEPLALTMDYVNAAGVTVFHGGPVTVTAAPTVAGQAPPPPIQIPISYTGPGASAVSVRIIPTALTVFTGDPFSFTAQALDASNAVVPATPIFFTVNDGPATVSANGTGSAGSTRGTAHVVAQLLNGATDVGTLTVQPRASALALVSGSGQSATVGTALASPLVVQVTATDGLGVSGVAVTFAVATGGGSVGTASTVTDASGNAQSTWHLGALVGAQTVTASAAGLAGSPVTFTATGRSAQPTRLSVTTQPASTTAGASMAAVVITALDAGGATTAGFTGAVTIALGSNPSAATLGGSTTVNAVAGVATFATLSVNKVGTSYTLVASSDGLTSATTSAFDIAAGAGNRLEFGAYPVAGATAGVTIDPITVLTRDIAGNVATGFSGAVTLAVGTGPAAATLHGTTTKNAVNGVATFDAVSLTIAGSYTLVASAAGVASGTGPAFTLSSGPATALVLVSGGAQSAGAGVTLPSPIAIQVTDAFGNAVPGIGRTVNVAVTTGGGSVSPAAPTTNAGGQVSTNWTLGGTIGPQTITASSTGLASVTVGATATSAGNHLTITQQPGATQVAGVSVTPSLLVEARDASNALVTSFTGTVSLAIGANPGGSTLGGTASVSAVGGVATFSAFNLNKAGAGYTVIAGGGVYGSVTSAAFSVSPAAASTLTVVSGDLQTGASSTLLPLPLVLKVSDAFGNGVSGRTITFAIATGGGALGTPSPTTTAAGTASTTWTLGAAAGQQTVTATSAGLTGSPLTFTANPGVAAIASTTVTPHLDTLTALTATFALAAQAKDALNNALAGTFTWVSRTPAAATVSAAGLVTAVANGSAWVVAIETGGTKDSALIVVQQRLATISVAPGVRSIYLTRNFAFTATAVDGLGTPMGGATTFTWSSTAPSVASVDTAGHVTAFSLGTTQIRATSGAITGVANVSVITPITRIVVAVDSGASSTNDVATLPSLGLHRTYVAIAHDTLDAVMAGVTFNWASTNGSVANIDSGGTGTTKARALTAANGLTSIQATAQGVTGTASLTVQQVLASITLSAATGTTIAVTGSLQLIAHGLDANAHFIASAIAFTYASSAILVATVNAAGVVTGVAPGPANMTAANGAITSNLLAITVANTGVPAVITFGRDTLSVGRGGTASIPILLSKPLATPLVVNLAVADTFAFWSTASVTIPANQTSINATINGHNAGTTHITATDGSGAGYAPASSVLAVQANLRLTSCCYSLDVTDQLTTQALLSDPSPAGGTYVTFSFGTAGRAQISPDPAFIPAGQLAADIVIRGTGAGSTTVTPSAIGVNGTASTVTTYAANLTFATTSIMLGQGQYQPGYYIYTPTYNSLPVPITLTSSDTTKVTVTPSVTIPGGLYYAYFTVSAVGRGTATITATSPGWTAVNNITVTSTTPHVGIASCCGTTLNTTSPQQGFYVYAEDSTKNYHSRTSSLVVRISSSDSTVLKVLDTVLTIAPGTPYNTAGRVIPGGAGGTAYLIATASGHTSDTVTFTVVGPHLHFSWSTNRVGAGQEDQNLYVYAPNNVTAPLLVTIANSDSTVVGLPTSVTITNGTYYAYVTVRGKAPGSVTLRASATGYQPDSAYYIVTTPHVRLAGGGSLNNFAPPQGFTVYSADTVNSVHYRTTSLVVHFTSSDTTVLKVDSTVTIAAGLLYANSQVVTPVGVGTAKIFATAPGHRPDSLTYTVITPKINVTWSTYTIGARQHRNPTDFYAYVPNNRVTPLLFTLTNKRPAVAAMSVAADTIPAGTSYRYLTFSGLTPGLDTVIISAPGYLSDTAFIRVTTPKLRVSGLPGAITTTNPPMGLTIYSADSLNGVHYASDTVVVLLTSTDTTVLRPVSRSIRILKGNYYDQSAVINVVGPGTARILVTDSAGTGYRSDSTNVVTVTGPVLSFYNATPVLGMRQNGTATGAYVRTPNNVASPLIVNLVSTSSRVVLLKTAGGAAAASIVDTIPAGTYYAYFEILAQDTLGTIQVQATATGYGGASTNVQVTQPKFVVVASATLNTTSPKTAITVFARDANDNTHYTNENVTVTLASSAPSVTIIDSATVTIPAGSYYNSGATWAPGVVGTSQISASDARATFYKYNTGTVNTQVVTPAASFSWSTTQLGIGQYVDYVSARTPDNMLAPTTVTLTHLGAAHIATSTNLTNTPISSVIIPASSYYSYFRIAGTSTGTDSLVASIASPFHNPATAVTVVGPGRIDPLSGWPSSIKAGDSVLVYLYALDPATNRRTVLAATTFNFSAISGIEFRSGGVSSAVITSVVIPADAQYVTFFLKGLTPGTAGATISATNYQTYVNTLTVTP